MIPFTFDYYKPESIEEAYKTFSSEWSLGKKVIFYSGGTEVITFARGGKLKADAVIDLKGIDECNVLKIEDDQLIIGSAVTLNEITESELFPMLGNMVRKIADHTSRNKITIGGNLLSGLPYREALLPLLVADALITVAGPKERDVFPAEQIAAAKVKDGSFITQIKVPVSNLNLPYACLKQTRTSTVGYPIVSIAAMLKNERIRIAFSGLSDTPFRSAVVEGVLNDHSLDVKERINKAVAKMPATIMEDFLASKKFRQFTLTQLLNEMFEELEEAQ
ncbi:FAD binding domain-containing protein [Sporosarcina sp. USHLN248]|uniref:FAD binding domain-containing protein n=1 Tax=Sporosarcina sp. USHLN248 TaxID=3081300 RepID=UPI003019754E